METDEIEVLTTALRTLGVTETDEILVETIRRDLEEYITVTAPRTGVSLTIKQPFRDPLAATRSVPRDLGRSINDRKFLQAVLFDPFTTQAEFDNLDKLLVKGVNPSQSNDIALKTAITKKNIGLIRFLIERISFIPDDTIGPLFEFRNPFITEFILKKRTVDRKEFGNSLDSGNLRIVGLFLKNGFDVNQALIEADSPLLYAIELQNFELVKFLIFKGADIHINNEEPLVLACGLGDKEIMKLLIEKGAIVSSVWMNDVCKETIIRMFPRLMRDDRQLQDDAKRYGFI
jgi:hypothetical protein